MSQSMRGGCQAEDRGYPGGFAPAFRNRGRVPGHSRRQGRGHTHPSRRGSALESYSPERRAESLLSNAVDGEDYACAEEGVRKMDLGPAGIAPLQSSKAPECLRGRSGLLGR